MWFRLEETTLKKLLIKRSISFLIMIVLIISLFNVHILALSNAVNSTDINLMPKYDEIEEWYNTEPTTVSNPNYIKYLQDAEKGDLSAYGSVIPSPRPVMESISIDLNKAKLLLPTQYYPEDTEMLHL